jgi:hypothetical protein
MAERDEKESHNTDLHTATDLQKTTASTQAVTEPSVNAAANLQDS